MKEFFNKENYKINYFLGRLVSIFEFNHIRLQKIFQMTQISFIALVCSLIIAPQYNKYIFSLNIEEETWKIFAKLSLEICILVIILYKKSYKSTTIFISLFKRL